MELRKNRYSFAIYVLCCKASKISENMISLRISIECAIIKHNAVRCWKWTWRHECINQMLCRKAEHFCLLLERYSIWDVLMGREYTRNWGVPV